VAYWVRGLQQDSPDSAVCRVRNSVQIAQSLSETIPFHPLSCFPSCSDHLGSIEVIFTSALKGLLHGMELRQADSKFEYSIGCTMLVSDRYLIRWWALNTELWLTFYVPD
jgi:hypothetical protein